MNYILQLNDIIINPALLINILSWLYFFLKLSTKFVIDSKSDKSRIINSTYPFPLDNFIISYTASYPKYYYYKKIILIKH